MLRKKLIALMLCVCLLFTTGCAAVDSLAGIIEEMIIKLDNATAGGGVRPALQISSRGDYFTHFEREEISFDQMDYVHCGDETVLSLCEAVYAIAEEGGSREELSELLTSLYTELCRVYTMIELASLKYYSDPSDSGWEEEMNYSSELYYRLYDEYMYALGALARSEHSSLLENFYYDADIDYLSEYYGEKPTDEELEYQSEMYSRELELINDYYELMAVEQPDNKAVAELFAELVNYRNEEAQWYGYDSYADYAYESFYYRNYSPEDVLPLLDSVKERFAPVSEEYYWNMVDIEEYVNLRSRLDVSPEAITDALGRNMPLLSTELADAFDYMVDKKLYDIAPAETKVDLGYTTRLYHYNVPYIFNSPYGYFMDYLDMIHEFGHFVNAFYTDSDLINGMSDNDLAELQSQGLEVMFTEYYPDIFGSYADDIEDYLLMDMVMSIVDGAMYDEFQQRVYAEENLSGERACEIFAEVYESYGYEPYEDYEYEWIYVVHNFEYPFYYISYAVSALSALEIYSMLQDDPEVAAEAYLSACAMDTEYYYFTEALSEIGLSDIFDPELCERLAGDILPRID